MAVTGAGSNWSNAGSIVVGGLGTGTVTVENGAALSSAGGSIGLVSGSIGTLAVTGAGSTWTNGPSGGLNIGSFGMGTLTIADGGKVLDLSIGGVKVALNEFSNGTLTVSGAGSIRSTSPIVIAAVPNSVGTVNIGAGAGSPAAAPGTLDTSVIIFGGGTGTINFNHTSANYVFAPEIIGNGTVNVLAGTTIFTGTNTYTGVTTIGAGTLQLGNGGANGSITGNVSNNGIFAINRSDVFNYDGVISGTGAVQQNGSGTTIFTGPNTYTGGTNISAGTLQLGNGGTNGSIVGDVSNNSIFAINRSDTFSYGGVISGSGAVQQNGTGTTIFTGTNTYTGATIISAGSLQMGIANALSASTAVAVNSTAPNSFNLDSFNQSIGSLTGSGAVTLGSAILTTGNDGTSTTYSGAIAGTGGLTKVGTGAFTLTGTNAYTGGTTISAGTLQLGNGGANGSITGNVSNNGIFAINRSDTFSYGGVISGAGAVQQNGTGTTIFTGTNTYTGATTITAGSLQMGIANALSTSTAVTVNSTAPNAFNLDSFNQSIGSLTGSGAVTLGSARLTTGNDGTSTTYSGAIAGTGGLIKVGTGAFTLTGTNTYTGGTTISAGTLQLGNGGTSGSIVGDVSNNGIFVINRSDAFSYGGVISGSGAVQQNGTGTTILTGANTYSGATNVNAGTLRAGALNTFSPGSAVTVASGGTLDLNGFNHTIVSIANAGRVSMGNGTAPGTVLTTPSYAGSGGTIAMNTVLGADNSSSDKLVINAGSATGNSFLTITNAGGSGELTTGSGILVVDAVSGGTTSAGAFAVKGIVAAGPYEYQLFRGGVGGASPNSWFLRNTVESPVTPEPPDPPVTPEPPLPPIPLYRPEAALYTQLPGVARLLDLAMLSTFHKRQGDQSLLLGAGTLPGSWGRIFGGHAEEHRSGLLSPEIEGNFWGFQVGQDLFGWDHDDHRDRIGLFLGHARADVDGRGFALAQQRALVGNLAMDATNLAAYWTHVGPSSWYVDAVLMASWFDGNPRSTRGVDLNADGTGVTASLEAGYPIPIGAGMVLEPQVQLISQHVDFENAQDAFATIRFDPVGALTGRIGARLVGEVASDGVVSKPYLFVNVWHNFDGTDTTIFNTTPITTSFGRTSLEFGGAISAQVSAHVSVYADASYTTNLGGEYGRAVSGNVGLRATW